MLIKPFESRLDNVEMPESRHFGNTVFSLHNNSIWFKVLLYITAGMMASCKALVSFTEYTQEVAMPQLFGDFRLMRNL